MPVVFHNADADFKPKHTALLKQFISYQFLKATNRKLNLSVVFCSDEYLLNINKTFLKHDYYTDIITFPLSETDKRTEAEIYISLDRIWDNAKKLKTSFDEELHRVFFHGVLHLTGLGDKTKIEKEQMTAAEDKWLKLYAKALKAA